MKRNSTKILIYIIYLFIIYIFLFPETQHTSATTRSLFTLGESNKNTKIVKFGHLLILMALIFFPDRTLVKGT